jgi:hypothetical protein
VRLQEIIAANQPYVGLLAGALAGYFVGYFHAYRRWSALLQQALRKLDEMRPALLAGLTPKRDTKPRADHRGLN